MPQSRAITVDGNDAEASVAHRLSEVIAIYPITERTNPDRFRMFLKASQEAADERYAVYRQLAGVTVPHTDATVDEEATAPEQEG